MLEHRESERDRLHNPGALAPNSPSRFERQLRCDDYSTQRLFGQHKFECYRAPAPFERKLQPKFCKRTVVDVDAYDLDRKQDAYGNKHAGPKGNLRYFEQDNHSEVDGGLVHCPKSRRRLRGLRGNTAWYSLVASAISPGLWSIRTAGDSRCCGQCSPTGIPSDGVSSCGRSATSKSPSDRQGRPRSCQRSWCSIQPGAALQLTCSTVRAISCW